MERQGTLPAADDGSVAAAITAPAIELPAAQPLARMRESVAARQELWMLGAITALAAALRFAGLGAQSYGEDEAAAVAYTHLLIGEFTRMFVHGEGNPPVYFAVARLWSKVFGTGEFGFRSLSAIAGIATVPLTYAAAARVSRRAALVAAAFVAVNPFLVWYSQEARPYALLLALLVASLVCAQRAIAGDRRWLAGWAATSALAIGTHFFALLYVAATAAWLLARRRDRSLLVAFAPVAIVSGACIAMAWAGRTSVSWVHNHGPLSTRLFDVPVQFLTGLVLVPWRTSADTAVRFLVLAALACAGFAVVFLFTRGRPRRAATGFAALAALTIVPTALIGAFDARADYLMPRYLIGALVPLLIVLAIGFTAPRLRAAGIVAAAAFAALMLSMTVSIAARPQLQRYPWREIAHYLGPAAGGRVVVAGDLFQAQPLAYYLPHVAAAVYPPLPDFTTASVRRLVLIDRTGRFRPPASSPVPGFRETVRRTIGPYLIVAYAASRPTVVDATSVMAAAAQSFGGVKPEFRLLQR